MNAVKILLLWAILTAAATLLVSAACLFVLMPLYYRLRSVAPAKRLSLRRRAAIMFVATMVITSLVCGTIVFDIQRYQHDFVRCRGSWNSWRIPLSEPFEIRMVDDMLHGSIAVWQQPGALLDNVLNVVMYPEYVVGATGARLGKNRQTIAGWFIFNCMSGEFDTFEDKAHFLSACSKAGLEMPYVMRSVRDTWYAYWKIIDD